MRDLLNKGFEALGRRDEKREEKLDALLTDHLEAMSHRPTLKRYVYVLGGINLLFWAAVLIRPYDVQNAFLKVSGVDNKLVMLVLTTIFGIGMWLTYALFRLKFPALEESNHSDELMASFAHQENAYRKVRVWVASVAGGVINLSPRDRRGTFDKLSTPTTPFPRLIELVFVNSIENIDTKC